jgi:hypothetical protein
MLVARSRASVGYGEAYGGRLDPLDQSRADRAVDITLS